MRIYYVVCFVHKFSLSNVFDNYNKHESRVYLVIFNAIKIVYNVYHCINNLQIQIHLFDFLYMRNFSFYKILFFLS